MDKKERQDCKNQLKVARFIMYVIVNVLNNGNTKETLMKLISYHEDRYPRHREKPGMAEWDSRDPTLELIQRFHLIQAEFKNNYEIFAGTASMFFRGAGAWIISFASVCFGLACAGKLNGACEYFLHVPLESQKTTQIMCGVSLTGLTLCGLFTFILASNGEFKKRDFLVKIAIGGRSQLDYLKLVNFCRTLIMLCPNIGKKGVAWQDLNEFYMEHLRKKVEGLILQQVMWICTAELAKNNTTNFDLPRSRCIVEILVNNFYLAGLIETKEMKSWYDKAKTKLAKQYGLDKTADLVTWIPQAVILEDAPSDPFPHTWPELA